MEIYVVLDIVLDYDGFERVDSIWLKEENARKALESLKKQLMEGRKDSRYKQWWAEEPIYSDEPDIIARYRLYDTANESREGLTDYQVEIKVLETGD